MSLILPLVIHTHALLSLTPHHPPFRYNDAHTQHANDPLITELSQTASQIKAKAALSAKQYMCVAAADTPSSASSSSLALTGEPATTPELQSGAPKLSGGGPQSGPQFRRYVRLLCASQVTISLVSLCSPSTNTHYN